MVLKDGHAELVVNQGLEHFDDLHALEKLLGLHEHANQKVNILLDFILLEEAAHDLETELGDLLISDISKQKLQIGHHVLLIELISFNIVLQQPSDSLAH